MEQINGKILVFTDLHLGLKSGSKSRLVICINVIKEIIQYIKQNNVQTCLFLGDWHHVRVSTENNVLNVSYKLMTALAKHCKVYCLLGNHDIYMKNTTEINSLVFFKNIANVKLIDSPTEMSINGNKTLLVPWLGDVSKYSNETFDMMFGHFDVSTKYLIKAYIEEHAVAPSTANSVKDSIDNDNMLATSKTTTTAGNYIGDFVDKVKNNGSIFTGHIHCHKETISKGRNFIFVGDPYQQNLGERNYTCGFYTINDDNSYEFHEIKSVPKHIEIHMSDVINNFDKFDFSIVKGNILHKIYDIEVDNIVDAKISQRINDLHPYEELLPDYEIDINSNSDIKMQNASIELIKKSKLDYIKNYIDNIAPEVLQEQSIDKDKLYEILKDYYKAVAEE